MFNADEEFEKWWADPSVVAFEDDYAIARQAWLVCAKRTAQECVEICRKRARAYEQMCRDNADGDGIHQSDGCDACAQAITERFMK
jgi:hypothetical protein